LSEADKKRRDLRVEFFSKLANAYEEMNPAWNIVKAQPQHWLSFGAGKTGLAYNWAFKMRNGWRFAIELYIDQHDKEKNKRLLKELEQMRGEMEKDLGFQVDFQELPEKRASRIELSRQTSGPITKLNEAEKDELVRWGAEKMSVFSKVMAQYIRKLE